MKLSPRVLISVICVLPVAAMGVYVPSDNDDWKQLKPDSESPEGSFDTVPFTFGIVVNPYTVNDNGEYKEPTVSSIQREITTTYTTAQVTVAPKATRTADIIHQISDGQVQRTGDSSASATSDAGEEDQMEKRDEESLEEENVEAESVAAESLEADEEEDDEDFEVANVEEERDEESFEAEEAEEEAIDEAEAGSYDENETEVAEEADDCTDEDDFVSPVYAVACSANTTLQMTLEDSILRDSNDRIGSIVSGRQFQFDGPSPQHGTIYAAGWSITNKGQLALGNTTKFYQCASGDFYNLYDMPIAYQCNPVTLDVVELIDC